MKIRMSKYRLDPVCRIILALDRNQRERGMTKVELEKEADVSQPVLRKCLDRLERAEIISFDHATRTIRLYVLKNQEIGPVVRRLAELVEG